MADETIDATIKVKLKPFQVPNFARRVGSDEADASGIPLGELDDDALEDLAFAWLNELYRKAGRRHLPIYRPAKCAPVKV